MTMVPTWTGKPEKMGKLFPVREKSGNFEQTGKVREFYPVKGAITLKPPVIFGITQR